MITVITSAFNAEKTLQRTIDSVKQQDWSDFEYIIVNHGSTDETGTIARVNALRDSRIRIVNIDHNSGYIGRALNYGIQHANGEYITFLDADDAYDPQYLNEMYQNISSGDYDLVICGFHRVDADGTILRTDTISNDYIVRTKSEYNCFWKEFIQNSFGYLYVWWNKLYRRSYLNQFQSIFPEHTMVHGDALFHAKVLGDMPRMYCSCQPLVYWSSIPGSCSYGTYKSGYYKEAADAAFRFAELTDQFLTDKEQRLCCYRRLVNSLPNLQRIQYYNTSIQEKKREVLEWITYPPYWNLVSKSNMQKSIQTILSQLMEL